MLKNMKEFFFLFLKNACGLYENAKKSVFFKINLAIALLIIVSHSGWIFGYVPYDDFWEAHTIATKSLGNVLKDQAEAMFGSPTYRILHIPFYWVLNKLFACHWWLYNSLMILLHLFTTVIFGKIIYRKTGSIEVASLALIFIAFLPTAVSVFGMHHLYSIFSALLMLICIYIFYKKGLNFLNVAIAAVLISIALCIYEAFFLPLALFGFFVLSKKTRVKYSIFMFLISLFYLIPNLIVFPKFKIWCLQNQKFDFLHIINFLFGPGSLTNMYNVFVDEIKGCVWNFKDIMKIIFSGGIVYFIWNYAKIGRITKNKAKQSSKFMFFCSLSIILGFTITSVLTWYQTEYLWYLPSIGVFLLGASILILFLGRRKANKIILMIILVFVALSNMSIFAYQKMWKQASNIRVSVFSFLDKYENFIPEKSSILFVNIPMQVKISDFLGINEYVLRGMMEWKYVSGDNDKSTALYSNPRYYPTVYTNNGFVKKFLQSDRIEIDLTTNNGQTHNYKGVNFSDIYLVGFEDNTFYPVSEVIVYDNDGMTVIKSLDFTPKELIDSKPVYITKNKGIKNNIYYSANELRYKL